MENKKGSILITFDLEEFDLPLEYNKEISIEDQLKLSTIGLDRILDLLEKYQIKATFFTTAFYAENRPEYIKQIVASGHELASHMYYHSEYDPEHIGKSKEKLEEISGHKVYGIRSPRLRELDPDEIKKANYTYNSSLNPCYLPGRYNNFSAPKTLFRDKEHQINILPFSVATIARIPLFWLAFKNMNLGIYSWLCKQALQTDGVLHLYFHPWEFAEIDHIDIPGYIKKSAGWPLVHRLEALVQKVQPLGKFVTVNSYITNSEN